MLCCAGSNRSGWVHYASITVPLRFLLILKGEDEGQPVAEGVRTVIPEQRGGPDKTVVPCTFLDE